MYCYNINKRKKKGINKRVIILIISLLILAGAAYILFFSPIFDVKTIEVSGNEELSADEIKNSLTCKNIFLTTKKEIKNGLFKKFPKILSLEIKKNLFRRKLEINLKEREEMGIACCLEKCFYIDQEGVVFEEAPQTSGSLILLIKDYSQRNYQLGDKVFDKTILDNVLFIKEELLSSFNLRAASFDFDDFPPEELRVMMSEGWYLLLSLKRDIKSQLQVLGVALEEKIKNRIGLQYIDLRIENRIYYK